MLPWMRTLHPGTLGACLDRGREVPRSRGSLDDVLTVCESSRSLVRLAHTSRDVTLFFPSLPLEVGGLPHQAISGEEWCVCVWAFSFKASLDGVVGDDVGCWISLRMVVCVGRNS